MKNYLFLTILLSASAHAQVTTPTEDAIAAQINTTKDLTDRLLRKLDQPETTTPVNIVDYRNFKKKFQAKIEIALTQYEGELKNDVFKRVSVYLDRYNAIATSKEYSEDQKQAILGQQRELIQNHLGEVSAIYQADLQKLYDLEGGVADHLDAKFISVSDNDDLGCYFAKHMKNVHKNDVGVLQILVVDGNGASAVVQKDCVIKTTRDLEIDQFGDRASKDGFLKLGDYAGTQKISDDGLDSSGDNYYGDDKKFTYSAYDGYFFVPKDNLKSAENDFAKTAFQSVTYPEWRKVCESQLCFSFVASEISLYLTTIGDSIDRDLEFKLADGNVVKLTGLRRFITKNPNDQTDDFEFADTMLARQLSSIEYPADYKTLNYDTGAAQ
jgi:hypothetical protein